MQACLDNSFAYVFEWQGDGTWRETAKLAASDGGEGDIYSDAVSLSGDLALVGATVYIAADSVFIGAAYLFRLGSETTATEEVTDVPGRFYLAQNHPNPFNPATVIKYDLPEPGEVTLSVYDLMGRKVATIASGYHAAGRYKASLNATGFASGVYLYLLQAGSFSQMKAMVLMR